MGITGQALDMTKMAKSLYVIDKALNPKADKNDRGSYRNNGITDLNDFDYYVGASLKVSYQKFLKKFPKANEKVYEALKYYEQFFGNGNGIISRDEAKKSIKHGYDGKNYERIVERAMIHLGKFSSWHGDDRENLIEMSKILTGEL